MRWSLSTSLAFIRFGLWLTLGTAGFSLALTAVVGQWMPHSRFFQRDNAALRRDESARMAESLQLIDSLIAAAWRPPTSQSLHTEICIAVSSGRARRHRYVMRTVATLLREWIESPDDVRDRIQLRVLAPPADALLHDDPVPLHHRDYDKLREIVPVDQEDTATPWFSSEELRRELDAYTEFKRNHSRFLGEATLAAAVERRRGKLPYWSEEIGNYVRALEACLMRSEYTLVVEDDAVAARDTPALLVDIVRQLEAMWTARDASRDWAWVKLFHTDRFDGWTRAHLHTLAALVGVPSVFAGFAARRFCRCTRAFSALIAGQVALALLIVLLGLGRQTFFASTQPMGLSPTKVKCCIPAQLYNNRVVPHIIAFLRQPPYIDPIDLLLDAFALNYANFTQYWYRPHLFQHIGRYATFSGKNQGRWSDMVVSNAFRGERDRADDA
jgi:hypothetical protein